jgi:hypothetical protein
MLDRLQARAGGTLEERRRELGVLAVALETLLDDLRSVGAGGAEAAALEKLLAALRGLPATVDEARMKAVWREVSDALQAFAGGKAPRRRSFWK